MWEASPLKQTYLEQRFFLSLAEQHIDLTTYVQDCVDSMDMIIFSYVLFLTVNQPSD